MKIGYGKTRRNVLNIAHPTLLKNAEETGKEFLRDKISQGWWMKFCSRWPQIRLTKGDSFPVARDQMTNYSVSKGYFDLIDDTLTKFGLKDKPAQIYNCDESGMPLEFKLPKIIAGKETKKVQQCTSGIKTLITILACANAAEQTIPAMVAFASKYFNSSLLKGEVRTSHPLWNVSKWLDGPRAFCRVVPATFAVYTQPLMLLLDGHSSHYTLELMNIAAAENVVIFCLLPHTTADSQPPDTSCFKPLKTSWADVCHKYLFANPGRVITKFHFSELFTQAWSNSMIISNIASGFRITGIYPLNPSVILKKFSDSQKQSERDSGKVTKEVTFSPDLFKKYEK